MKIIKNNHGKGQKTRNVWCPHCKSELQITDADIFRRAMQNLVTCACCKKTFPAMTEAETTEAYSQK